MAQYFEAVDCDTAEPGHGSKELLPLLFLRDGPRRFYFDEGSRRTL